MISKNKYYLAYLLVFDFIIIIIHYYIIHVHPFSFFIWPLSFFLFFSSFKTSRILNLDLSIMITSFVLYTAISYSLILDKPEGIIYNTEPMVNMTFITNIILLVSIVLFITDLYQRKRPLNYDIIIKFIGIASSIPWVSTLLSETFVLFQWANRGIFLIKTSGKAVGGAGINDVLFQYGYRNFMIAISIVLLVKIINTISIRARAPCANTLCARASKTQMDEILKIFAFIIFFLGCYAFTGIFHESGHAIACNMLGVKIHNITIEGFGRNAVTRQYTGIPFVEALLGFSGGAVGTLVFSMMYLIFDDGDIVVRINFLGFSLSQIFVALIEGFAISWYRVNSLLICQGGLFLSIILAGILEYAEEVKKHATRARALASAI